MNATLPELIATLGVTDALKLVQHYGGTRVFLPLPGNVDPENPVAKVIGVEKTRKLAELWPQERPYLPRAVDYLKRARDRALRADARSMSVPQVALKYELTERQVYKVLAAGDYEPTTLQKQLF